MIFKDLLNNSEVSYGIEFTPWEEWLGMTIEPASLEAFDEVAILAHCLWERTWGKHRLAKEELC